MQPIVGAVYRLMHKRKGQFIAQHTRTEPGDAHDPLLWVFRFDTRPGTGQERLARAANAQWTETALRPSFILELDLLEGRDWHLQQARQPFQTAPPIIARRKPWYAGLRRLGIKYLHRDLFRKLAERES